MELTAPSRQAGLLPEELHELEAVPRELRIGAKRYGIHHNLLQVLVQLFLAALIGISLRLVLLPQALREKKGQKAGFLIYFGVAKAACGAIGGSLADYWGRKRVSIVGWLLGVSMIPIMLLATRLESRVLERAADVLLGCHQGLTWGINIICLMDILGPSGRGMASALSNAIGYSFSAFTAHVAAWMVAERGIDMPVIALTVPLVLGLALVLGVCEETSSWLQTEDFEDERNSANERPVGAGGVVGAEDGLRFYLQKLSCNGVEQARCSLVGLTVNLATGVVWGAAVLWAKDRSEGALDVYEIGNMEAIHTYGKVLAMLLAGVSFYILRPRVVVATSLTVMSLGLGLTALQARQPPAKPMLFMASLGLIGVGVGGAFPALAAAVTATAAERHRASVYGGYRFWRDFGYAAGGLATRAFDWDGFRSITLVVFFWSTVVTCITWIPLLWPHSKGLKPERLSDCDS